MDEKLRGFTRLNVVLMGFCCGFGFGLLAFFVEIQCVTVRTGSGAEARTRSSCMHGSARKVLRSDGRFLFGAWGSLIDSTDRFGQRLELVPTSVARSNRHDNQSIEVLKKPKPGVPTRALTSSWAGTDSARRSAESLVAQMPSQGPPRRRPRPLFLRPCHTVPCIRAREHGRSIDRWIGRGLHGLVCVRVSVVRSIDQPRSQNHA